MFYDFYSTHHPEMERYIYDKQKKDKNEIAVWSDLLNTFHYFSKHKEMSMETYLSRQLYEDIMPISRNTFLSEPTKINFIGLLKGSDDYDTVYYDVINTLSTQNIIPKMEDKDIERIIKTYKPWKRPLYDKSHILIALWVSLTS